MNNGQNVQECDAAADDKNYKCRAQKNNGKKPQRVNKERIADSSKNTI
jgi:hypothetical protein